MTVEGKPGILLKAILQGLWQKLVLCKTLENAQDISIFMASEPTQKQLWQAEDTELGPYQRLLS
jgi:hypothetical protein